MMLGFCHFALIVLNLARYVFLNVFLLDKTSKKHVFVLIFLFQKNIAKYKKIKAKTIESQHFSKLKFLDGQAS